MKVVGDTAQKFGVHEHSHTLLVFNTVIAFMFKNVSQVTLLTIVVYSIVQ